MMKKTVAGYGLLLAFLSVHPAASGQDRKVPAVHIETGDVSGIAGRNGRVIAYKGIPYALPPVGNLRWREPQPAASWSGVRACNTFGPSPYQNKPVPFSMWSEEFLIPEEPISEDCLYLNVWGPVTKAGEKWPVLVWIYGGGFSSGGSAAPIYDGEATAEKGIVFVSFNYRVGIFGFFAHPELSRESGYEASGNYGLLDQLAALKWVRRNIAAFGGDPDNITIAGQSAGSMSVNCLLASPMAKGLFQKAIAESGAMVPGSGADQNTLKSAEEQGSRIALQLKAGSLAELRTVPAAQLLNDARGAFGPVTDGYVLPQSVPDCFAAGRQLRVPLLIGWNEDEGLLSGPLKNAEGFKNEIGASFGADAPVFFKFYPANDETEALRSQYHFARDLHFGIQAYTLANEQSGKGQPVYLYRFSRKLPATGKYVGFGAFHTGEVPYVYDNLRFVNRPWEAVDHELARILSFYWANFIRSGNPNGKGLPVWPLYSVKNTQAMILGENPHAQELPDKEALDFLLKIVKR